MANQGHPAFWWVWAIFLTIALIRVDSTLLLLGTILALILLISVIGVPTHRRSVLRLAIRFALFAFAVRAIFTLLISVPIPGRVLFTLPQLALPEFMVGIRIGGPITLERLTAGFSEGLLLATLCLIFGLANALSSPTRLIKVLPARFYGIGVAATLATTIAPGMAKSIERIRTAQHLRGQRETGLGSWQRLATPVLEESLSRSIDLAGALEARGYGVGNSPTRYRPISWSAGELISLAAMTCLAFLIPSLSLSATFELAICFALIATPAVLR